MTEATILLPLIIILTGATVAALFGLPSLIFGEGTSIISFTGSARHVILSDSEESPGWRHIVRFFVAYRLLRITVNEESLNLGKS